MARQIKIESSKTYATEANAVKAVEKIYGKETDGLVFFVMKNDEGRYFPVFVGQRAAERGVHFHFNVVA